LNGIWEGSANVICLDALRALARSPDAFESLAQEAALALDSRIDARFAEAGRLLADPARAEANARSAVESLALGMQASLMKRHAEANAAEAFCVSRLASGRSMAFGTLELESAALSALVERARLSA
jgi:putative acyl-CoA dehydrogenase